MGQNVSVYFKDNEKELLEWIDDKVEEGKFRNRAHAVTRCIKYTKENGKDIEEYL